MGVPPSPHGVVVFKRLNSIIDSSLKLIRNSKIHRHNTRHAYKLHLIGSKTNWVKQELTFQAATDFNNGTVTFMILNRY